MALATPCATHGGNMKTGQGVAKSCRAGCIRALLARFSPHLLVSKAKRLQRMPGIKTLVKAPGFSCSLKLACRPVHDYARQAPESCLTR